MNNTKKSLFKLMILVFLALVLVGCNNVENSNDMYTVTFDSDGGNYINSMILKKDSEYENLPIPSKNGYTFLGWYWGSTLIKEGDTIIINENHTLFAKWEKTEIKDPIETTVCFKVSFSSDNDLTYEDIIVTNGEIYSNLPVPIKEGYTFLGWYKGSSLISNNTIVELNNDIVLYAHWQKDVVSSENNYITPFIAFNDTEILYDGEGIEVNKTNNTVTITSTGTYNVYGNINDGQIIVNGKKQDVTLVLNTVTMYSSSSAPIYVLKAASLTLTLAAGTTNTITDGNSYVFADGEDEPSAAIFTKSDLFINGSGKLIVNGNFANGVQSKDTLTVESGIIEITAVNDGLKGKDFVNIKGGTLTINSGNDGIESTNEDDSALGYIEIENGYLDITSGDNAIKAVNYLSVLNGEITIDSGDNGLKSDKEILINSGTINIKSLGDGIKASNTLDTLGKVSISGGYIQIDSEDDGIQTVESFTITKGSILIEALSDGIKVSNSDEASGSCYLEGGILNIIADGDGIQVAGDVIKSGADVTIIAGEDGIVAKNVTETAGSVIISDGTLEINSYNDGIQAITLTKISGGDVNITTIGPVKTNSTISSKGIKATNSLVIDGGHIIITSTDHSIHSSDMIEINSGIVEIASTYYKGISGHGNVTINGGTINVSKSTEGIESKKVLTINDGIIHLMCSDDGLNSGGTGGMGGFGGFGGGMGRPGKPGTNTSFSSTNQIILNGGYIYINASRDGIDSNGNLTINGGTTIINGPTSNGDGTLDADGEILVNGGLVLAIGSSGMVEVPKTTSKQYSISFRLNGSISPNTIIRIEDSSGNDIITFCPIKTISSIIFSSSNLNTTETYYIYVGGSYNGGTIIDGIYNGGSYSNSNSKINKTFKLNSITTNISLG